MAGRKRNLVVPYMGIDEKEDLDNLLVFGYECKIFRDDEKASFIDEGRHLIPWMGDPSLLIDRYDGRGHLYDLKPYDASLLPSDSKQLSTEDQQIERLIDEERYMELHSDIMERAMYEEEELKRLSEALQDDSYGAVGFSYEQQYDPSQPTETKLTAEEEEEEEEEEETYEPHRDLNVPIGMMVPKTVKLNAIIEKTARFISEHGMQMEIVIKTKQSDNPQFEFLHFEDELNPYYKHVVQMIKSGRYRPQVVKEKRKRSLSSEDGEHGYLHPSLMPAQLSPPENFFKTVRSKLPTGQIVNTPYARLVKNIGKHTEHDQRMAQRLGASASNNLSNVPPPPLPPGLTLPTLPTLSVPQPSVPTTNTNNLYENNHTTGIIRTSAIQPPVPGVDPVVLPYPPIALSSHQQQPTPQTEHVHVATVESSVVGQSRIVAPPPEKRLIVDRMALYVAKNGADFETVVKSKDDTRFDFVQTWNEYFPYYEHMRKQYEKEYSTLRYEKNNESRSSPGLDDSNRGPGGKAVTFTIKTRDSDTPTLGSSAALLYESSEEEKDEDEERTGEETQIVPVPIVHEVVVQEKVLNIQQCPVQIPDKVERTQVSAENLVKKQAKEKIKDRLALAARDKLAQSSKEKQLKAERKRKAAMFVNMLKDRTESSAPSTSVETQDKPQPVSSRSTHSATHSDVKTATSTRLKTGPSPTSSTSSKRSHSQETSKKAGSSSSQRRPRSPSHLYKKRRPRSPMRTRSRSRSLSPRSRKRKHKSRTSRPSAFVDKRRSPLSKKRPTVCRVQTSADDPIHIDDD